MTYVTSDLHGYPPDKLNTLLNTAGFCKEDTCYVLGDVVDRGEDSVKLLRWLMQSPEFRLVMGNHESMLLCCEFLLCDVTDSLIATLTDNDMRAMHLWLKNGGRSTLDGLRKCTPDTRFEILSYLKSAPLFETVHAGGKDFLLVHSGLGGFDKSKTPADYTADQLLHTRPRLCDRYYSDVITVFGHTPTEYYGRQFAGRAIKTQTWINIDTGAALGNPPMLLRLDDMKEFYV